jgi:hypothetical protein
MSSSSSIEQQHMQQQQLASSHTASSKNKEQLTWLLKQLNTQFLASCKWFEAGRRGDHFE